MKRSPKPDRRRPPLLAALAASVALVACGSRFTSSEAGAAGTPADAGTGTSGQGSAADGAGGSSTRAGSAGSIFTAGAAGEDAPGNGGNGGTGNGGVLSEGGASALAGAGASGSRAGAGGKGGTSGNGGTGLTGGGGGGISGGGISGGGISGGGISGGGISGGGSGGWSPCTPALMIDDMEDGNDRNCPNQGRNGEWWSSTGTLTGTIEPPKSGEFPAFALGADARVQSNYGMRLTGKGFGHAEADWASIGFNLIDNAAYDLGPYQGLAFYAKSKAGALTVHVEFATNTTTATSEGGACQSNCNDHWAKAVSLDGSWRELSVPFASLAQEGWGVQPKDLAHTRFVYFGFLGTDGGPAAFEFLIDDVRLY